MSFLGSLLSKNGSAYIIASFDYIEASIVGIVSTEGAIPNASVDSFGIDVSRGAGAVMRMRHELFKTLQPAPKQLQLALRVWPKRLMQKSRTA